MKKLLAFSLLAVFLVLPVSAKAAYLKAVNNGSETIGAEEIIKNGYIAGSNLNIDANVQKDLFIAGSNININGSVQNSLVSAGNKVSIRGAVGDSVRAAGSDVTIENSIGGDALLAGNNIILSDKSSISGDLLMAANTGWIKGNISGDAKIVGSDITIDGKIDGDLLVRDVKNLTITKNAVINGKLTYYSPNQASIEAGSAVKGSVDFHKTATQGDAWKPYAKKASTATMLYQIIGSILLLLIFISVAPKLSRRFVDYSFKEAFKNSWWGLLALIVAPILAIILLVISFKLTAVIFLSYFLLTTLASIFSTLLAGSWLLKTMNKTPEYPINWQSIVLGAIVVALLSYLPIAGGLIVFILLLISLGSLIKLAYDGIAQ